MFSKLKLRLRKRKFYYKLLKRGILVSILAIIFSHFIVEGTTKKHIYSSVDSIPKNRVALLLGTNKFVKNGNPNLYYTYRINAAAKLYKSGKIRYIIVSGDNSRKKYNEPAQMR